jgi:CheY-like chemotaxis protein
MPVMDGLEATRQLRRDAALAGVPIISVSAVASTKDRAQSLNAGANAFLPKPIDLELLAGELGGLLNISWVYEEPLPGDADPAAEAMTLPPLEELRVLHRLARIGNISAIRQQADHIAALGDAYGPFADKLRRMAAAFQTREILHFVEQCIGSRR